MRLATVDYSINSPGITTFDENGYHFFNFFHLEKTLEDYIEKSKAENALLLKDIVGLKDLTIQSFTRNAPAKEIYTEKEVAKLEDAMGLAVLISNAVTDKLGKVDHCAFEGYAYGSMGNSLIDLAFGVSIVRMDMYLLTNANLHIFAPTEIKKLAGKGNANKLYMYEAFLKNQLNDPHLEQSEFYQWIKNNENRVIKIKKNGDKEIVKPFDDVIDSYWILQKLKSELNKSK